MSGLQLLDPRVLTRGMTQLRVDLEDGTWQRKNNSLLGHRRPEPCGSADPDRSHRGVPDLRDLSADLTRADATGGTTRVLGRPVHAVRVTSTPCDQDFRGADDGNRTRMFSLGS